MKNKVIVWMIYIVLVVIILLACVLYGRVNWYKCLYDNIFSSMICIILTVAFVNLYFLLLEFIENKDNERKVEKILSIRFKPYYERYWEIQNVITHKNHHLLKEIDGINLSFNFEDLSTIYDFVCLNKVSIDMSKIEYFLIVDKINYDFF